MARRPLKISKAKEKKAPKKKKYTLRHRLVAMGVGVSPIDPERDFRRREALLPLTLALGPEAPLALGAATKIQKGLYEGLTRENPRGSRVQSLVFVRTKFTVAQAKAWAKKHGFRYGKVDTTERVHRLRQFDPATAQKNTFGTIKLAPGVLGVVAVPKRANTAKKAFTYKGHRVSVGLSGYTVQPYGHTFTTKTAAKKWLDGHVARERRRNPATARKK